MNTAKSNNNMYHLKRCNDTRWNSTRNAIERFLMFKKEMYYHAGETYNLSSSFWKCLSSLLEILQPFKEATDAVQSDSATMHTFYNAFNKMRNEMQLLSSSNNFLYKEIATAALKVIFN
jgi:hypothetical protein